MVGHASRYGVLPSVTAHAFALNTNKLAINFSADEVFNSLMCLRV